jgi:hypothetical protein
MDSKRFRIVHHISEGDDPRPVVTHLFYGDTPEEAKHIYASHRETDSFLRQCDDKRNFEGKFPCKSVAFLEEVKS